MCRKLFFLVCVVLFCAGTLLAVPIDDCRYNLGFELMIDPNDANGCGNLVCGHTSEMTNVLAWQMSASFAGVDVNAPYNTCGDDRDWGIIPEGNAFAYMQAGKSIYQVLDPAFDGNATIVAGRKYTLTFDGTVNSDTPRLLGYSFFYGDNYEANEIVGGDLVVVAIPHPSGKVDWTYDETLSFVSEAGQDYLGQPLGIRFDDYKGQTWLFVDDVRVDWIWATAAFNPVPADGGGDVARDANLAWTPGNWADDTDGHHVYFGTSLADVQSRDASVYFGVQSPNSFDPTPGGGQLVLGETYYWAVDTVNDTWPGIPGVPDPPWVGEVWTLEVTGYATNPNPPDEAEDVPFLGTVLSWSPGTDSNSHDVYFGTDEDDVSNATTSAGLGVFIDNREANSYDPCALLLGKTYYWRIDEVNETAGTLMKGKLWEFTVAPFLPLDTFDSYPSNPALNAVWKDYWVNGTGAEVYINTDANFSEDGNSMQYGYDDATGAYGYYSEAYADITDLGITANWSVGGLEVLALSFMGDYDNAPEDMYVALRDGSGRTGKVLYDGDPNDLRREWLGFQEWNIELQGFVDDNSVDLTDISRITIGFGDKTAGGTGTVYFDNIRLYPPRCVPQLAPSMGSFRYLDRYAQTGSFEPDCSVDNYDLWTLAGDWLISGIGDVTAASASTTGIVGHWTMDDDTGGGPGYPRARVVDSSGNLNHAYLYNGFYKGLPVLGNTSANHTTDRVEGTGALTLDGLNDWIAIPNYPNLNSNTITVSAWIKPDDMLGEYASYPGIVSCDEVNGFKLCFGSTSAYLPALEWSANNELGYFWTGWAWDHHSELIMPVGVWSFVALVVEPTKGTLYHYDGLKVSASTNYEPHVALPFNNKIFIGGEPNYADGSGEYLDCTIDDVYFYNRSLAPAEVLDLAGLSGTYHLGLEPWRPDPGKDDEVNFEDFGVMADNWLQELVWP